MPSWVLSRPSGVPDPVQIGTGGARVSATYGVTVNLDASLTSAFLITATNGTAFTIAAPTNLTSGQTLLVTVKNTSGGALGVITWNAIFKMAAWTSPANANNRSIEFIYDGTSLYEIARTTTDIPN